MVVYSQVDRSGKVLCVRFLPAILAANQAAQPSRTLTTLPRLTWRFQHGTRVAAPQFPPLSRMTLQYTGTDFNMVPTDTLAHRDVVHPIMP